MRRSGYRPLPTTSQPGSTSPSTFRSRLPGLLLPSFRRLLPLLLALPPLVLLLTALLAYLIPPSAGYMRPCLPFSLSRISTSAHRTLSCKYTTSPDPDSELGGYKSATTGSIDLGDMPVSTAATTSNGSTEERGRLGDWLQSVKDEFLGDIRAGRGKGWTVTMGNEAGDLDSLSSSISLAHLFTHLRGHRSVPLSLTPRPLLPLRPENLLALSLAHVPDSTLLHIDELPVPPSSLSSLGVTFALVDHNRLLPLFQPEDGSEPRVEAVIDHHEDEHQYPSASPRLIQVPTGSCSSLVATEFMDTWRGVVSGPAGVGGSPIPSEVATLLLAAMVIDTSGLKDGGKAVQTDLDAAAFLLPLSDLPAAMSIKSTRPSTADLTDALGPLADDLIRTKFDVAHLSTHQLLQRDYKEYTLPTASAAFPSLQVGLATVPLALKKWLDKEGDGWASWLGGADGYMAERKLDVLAVLTSYKSETKGKGRREVVLLVAEGVNLRTGSGDGERVVAALSEGLEKSDVLMMEPWGKKGWTKELYGGQKKKKQGGGSLLDGEGRWGRVWQQGNAKATRKQVAPIFRDLIAELQ